MLIVLENLGNITGRCAELDEYCVTKQSKNLKFSEDARTELTLDMTAVVQMFEQVLLYLKGEKDNPIAEFNKNKEKLIKLRNKARKNNAKRMQQKDCKKESGGLYNQIMFSLERITHDCFNMLENNISQFKVETGEE
jgi:Na+/phosphate symporter